MLRPHDDKTLTQKLMPIGIAAVVLGALYVEAPRQWAKYQLRQGEVTRVTELQRSNQLMEQERAIANTRYEQDCLLLYEAGQFAQIVPNAVVIAGTNGQPLQPGLVVCDGIGGTAVVGEGGKLTQFSGNASPGVVQKAIERAASRGIVSPQVNSTQAEG